MTWFSRGTSTTVWSRSIGGRGRLLLTTGTSLNIYIYSSLNIYIYIIQYIHTQLHSYTIYLDHKAVTYHRDQPQHTVYIYQPQHIYTVHTQLQSYTLYLDHKAVTYHRDQPQHTVYIYQPQHIYTVHTQLHSCHNIFRS